MSEQNKPEDGVMVSVLIPTYHSGETLVRAIESVLAQVYEPYEVIVVDDNAPDDPFRASTEKLMEKYKDCGNVIYIQHEENKNGAAARNTAFRHSSGEYITFLDDDDFYYPGKLSCQTAYLNAHPQSDGCYCWRRRKGKDECGIYTGDLTYEILSLTFTPTTPCLMIRRHCYEALGGFDESYRRHQDFEFLLRYFKQFRLDYVPEVQVELSTNGVDNTPKGIDLVHLKEKFFDQFRDEIDAICRDDPKKGQKLYRNHWVRVYKDLIRDRKFKLAGYVRKTYGPKCGPGFIPMFVALTVKARARRYAGKIFGKKQDG